MERVWLIPVLASILFLSVFVATDAFADGTITTGSASPLIGPIEIRPGPFNTGQASAGPYDTTNNLAFQGGLALPAIASHSAVLGDNTIHSPEFANDGFYGNGASSIPALIPDGGHTTEWIKIDLGGEFVIDTITFGRDRLGFFDDRDPSQFTVSTSLNDAVYANENDDSDSLEYTQIVDSSLLGYNGIINGPQTIQVNFDPVNARFIKLEFTNIFVAIDEIQVFGLPPPVIDTPVGGTFIPIDTTTLPIAGLQSTSMWMIPILAGIGIGVFVIMRRK